ncbi:WD40-repeat-containing domain protein [Bombardia bombarda]|uniref:WD40-repeat-containing domain protein n=1 Tax=Bombardia bombarda TaxID=252184 RepID=A0AA39XIM7_9PEZI|nr:WD40-repeat-containing domain protein [Bombardia bombarda]
MTLAGCLPSAAYLVVFSHFKLCETDRSPLFAHPPDYRETAAKLQKEWRVQAPHRDFEFAAHVNTYALVTLLNEGLILEEYQRQFKETQEESRNVSATAARGVFGPLIFEQPEDADAEHEVVEDEELEEDDEDENDESEPEQGRELEPEESENPRKRPMDRQHHRGALPNGSPAKRQRLSNGYDNGSGNVNGNVNGGGDLATTPMEVDHADDNNHAYPSPLEGEQAASPPPRTEGPEQGTQVEKVHELTQQTAFLRLGAAESSPEAASSSAVLASVSASASAPSPTRANENPIVLHCEWNPKDPSILAAAGTDALARVWTVSRGAAPPDADGQSLTLPSHVDLDGSSISTSRAFKNLLDDDVPRNATVSAMAWNSAGDAIALAFEFESKACIGIWGLDGTVIQRFQGIEPPVIKLRWSPNNDRILGIGPENRGTLITLFHASNENSMSHFLPDHDLNADPLDAAWISETEFVLCGGDSLIGLQWTEQGIVQGRNFPTGRDESFSQVQFDWRTKLIATASEKGHIDLWDEAGKRRTISAHIGVITALQWQPLQTDAAEDERLLASGGEDGAICIWNVRNMDNRPKYSMTMSHTVVGLSITPDGAFIAGATSDRILIWKIGDHAMPRASWSRVPHPGWQSPKAETEEEFLPCLGWNSEGQQLVYGANSRLAVINFR